MQGLARNKYVLGRWRKIGDEYRLFATYKGEPPPRPRPVPPEVEYAIKHNTEVKVDPGPSLPTASRWTAGA